MSITGNTGRNDSPRIPVLHGFNPQIREIRGQLLTMVSKNLHDEASHQQVLGFRDELTIGPAGVVSKAMLSSSPYRERHGHVPAILHQEAGGIEARLSL